MKHIILDFSKITSPIEVEKLFKDTMIQNEVEGFPYFYGENLSALWDTLTGFIETPIHFTVKRYKGDNWVVQDYTRKFIETIVEAEEYKVFSSIE